MTNAVKNAMELISQHKACFINKGAYVVTFCDMQKLYPSLSTDRIDEIISEAEHRLGVTCEA